MLQENIIKGPQLATVQYISALDQLKCFICHNIFHRPVQLPCQIFACAECVAQKVVQNENLECPCRHTVLTVGCVTGYQVIRVIRIFTKTYPFKYQSGIIRKNWLSIIRLLFEYRSIRIKLLIVYLIIRVLIFYMYRQ